MEDKTSYFKIESPNELIEFAKVSGYSLKAMEPFPSYSLSECGENSILSISFDELSVSIVNRQSRRSDTYLVEDWDNISFDVTPSLNLLISNGKLFLKGQKPSF